MENKIVKTYQDNTFYLQNLMKGFSDDDLKLCTGESNSIGWIFGHIILYRGKVLERLNNKYHVKEDEQQFGRGSIKNKNISMSFNSSMAEFISRGEQLEVGLNNVTEDELRKPVEIKYQGKDLDLEGMIGMLSWHETFHLGQIDLILAAVGKGGVK